MRKKQQQEPRTITMTEETFLKLQQSQPPANPIPLWFRALLPGLLSLVAHPLVEALQPFLHHG